LHKLTAFICVLAFFALQYGKVVSYWECRFSAAIAMAPCDCVQVLLDTHKDNGATAAMIVKEKAEDVQFCQPTQLIITTPEQQLTHQAVYVEVMPNAWPNKLFQPPRA
jgi:nitrous oxide reductase accessory protein NosL